MAVYDERLSWLLEKSAGCLSSSAVSRLVDYYLASDTHGIGEVHVNGLGVLLFPVRLVDVVWANIIHVLCLDDYRLRYLAKLRPASVVDVGAFIGISTLRFARLYWDAEIIAVEPNPYAYRFLVDNVELNNLTGRVRALRYAVAPRESRVKLYVSDNWVNTSLSPDYSRFIGARDVEVLEVDAVKLSKLLLEAEEPLVLKVDIEGAEEPVVEEAVKTGILVPERALAVIVEAHTPGSAENVGAILGDAGFECVKWELPGAPQWVIQCRGRQL